MATNITEVRLLAVPLENDYKHTLVFFNGTSEQEEYFKSKTKWEMSECTYLRKEGYIRFSGHYDVLQNCNYVMYKNRNKWYYAFITKMEYVNEELTHIYIETDVLQTWYDCYTIKPSFVEREHSKDDIIGENTVPEMLETGEYVCQKQDKDKNLVAKANDDSKSGLSVILSSTVHVNIDGELEEFNNLGKYNGIYSATTYKAFDLSTQNAIDSLNSDIKQIVGKHDGAINGVFLYPTNLLSVAPDGGRMVLHGEKPNYYSVQQGKMKTIKGYEKIRNNKLLTYPYVYLMVSNNNGTSAIYQQELFSDDEMNFNVIGCVTPGGSIKLIPQNYKGAYLNYEESINAGKFPICSFNNDMYTNWLTQNSVNIAVDIASGLGAIAGGLVLGGGSAGLAGIFAGASIVGGVEKIGSIIGQIYEHSLIPPQTKGNLNSGDVVTGQGENTFIFYHMCIKPEYARIIDDYFTMFGYKTNRVKVPNKWHRQNFWYTKTIDVDIDSTDIPNNDIRKIKDIYNNGVTFWIDPENIGNYLVPNDTGLG